MLTELRVRDLALIESLEISFTSGLNVISGETGAGKSILLKSLGLLMGAKATAGLVRQGAEFATIEGAFDLSERPDVMSRLQEMGISVEDEIMIVHRQVSEERSRIFINGQLSTAQSLRETVAPLVEASGHYAPLIEMTSQGENRQLLHSSYQLELLDRWANLIEQRKNHRSLYRRWQSLQEEAQQLSSNMQHRAQRLDFLRFQRDEIVGFSPQPGEESELEAELLRLKSQKKYALTLQQLEMQLCENEDSVTAVLGACAKSLFDVGAQEESLRELAQQLENAKGSIEDTLFSVRKKLGSTADDPDRFEEVSSRLSDYKKLGKKYGTSSAEILQKLVGIENEIQEIENFDSRWEKIQNSIQALDLEMTQTAQALHQARTLAASRLADKISEQMEELNLKGTRFCVACETTDRNEFGETHLEFQIRSGPKELGPRSIAKGASGGELSRILLALKVSIGDHGSPRTFLFDEVDSGISGGTAERVGQKLKLVASGQQVICVTHLAQVAAFADCHFLIEKSADQHRMRVQRLTTHQRVTEIARLISGTEVTKTSLAHAESLLALATTPPSGPVSRSSVESTPAKATAAWEPTAGKRPKTTKTSQRRPSPSTTH